MPPWINKFYILDLRPKNSFVRWAVEQGHTVFVVSWVNPDERLAAEALRRLHARGPARLRSTRSSRRPASARSTSIGYCLGGTLLAATLAYMAAKGDDRFTSATYLRDADRFRRGRRARRVHRRGAAASLEERMQRSMAISRARDMATTFNMLRANDLIWSFVVNNYLLGKEPFPFDLLYWNAIRRACRRRCTASTCATCTRRTSWSSPAASRSTACRSICARSRCRASSCRRARTISRRGNRPMPRRSSIRARSSSCSPPRATSPASSTRRSPRNTAIGRTRSCRRRRRNGSPAPTLHRRAPGGPPGRNGSRDYGGGKVPARKPGDGKLKPLEDAPGSYVLVKAN